MFKWFSRLFEADEKTLCKDCGKRIATCTWDFDDDNIPMCKDCYDSNLWETTQRIFAKRDKAKREADINEIVERVYKKLAEMNEGNL